MSVEDTLCGREAITRTDEVLKLTLIDRVLCVSDLLLLRGTHAREIPLVCKDACAGKECCAKYDERDRHEEIPAGIREAFHTGKNRLLRNEGCRDGSRRRSHDISIRAHEAQTHVLFTAP